MSPRLAFLPAQPLSQLSHYGTARFVYPPHTTRSPQTPRTSCPFCRKRPPIPVTTTPVCTASSPEPPQPRKTDARGFVLPQQGDVVLYQGKWPGEDEAGLVDAVRYIAARDIYVVDVTGLRRVTNELFAVPSSARRDKPKWFDVADVRVASKAQYVASQDAYRVTGANDGYAPVRKLGPGERDAMEREYRAMQREMLSTTAVVAAVGTTLPLLAGRLDLSGSFAAGAAASLAYVVLLQRAVDAVGKPRGLLPLPMLRFLVPALPFFAVAYAKLARDGAPMTAWLGSLSKQEALAIVLGLLSFKAPLVQRTAAEIVDGLADIELGKSGMVTTAASLLARQIRRRRDASSPADSDESGDVSPAASPATRVLVIAGPSGVGKKTLVDKLLEDYNTAFNFSVSHTTRAKRADETEGEDYIFVPDATFDAMVARGDFVEFARVHGQSYGTSYASVEAASADGRVCVLELDVQGVQTLREKSEQLLWDARFVWVAPPSVGVLEKRLRARGSETDETIRRRLDTAVRELSFAATNAVFDVIILNDELDKAYRELCSFVDGVLGEWRR